MSKRFRVNSLALLAIATILGVLGVAMISTMPAAAQASADDVRQSTDMNLDEQLLAVSKQDPAFGGMYFDEDGRLNMYVLKSALSSQDGFSRLAGMSLAVESVFKDYDMMAAAATRRANVIPADYSFSSLYGWHETLKSEALALPGVSLTDIAEDLNRVRVGVETPEAADAVRAVLASRGIPAEAVRIESTSGFRQMATLRSRFRPLIGGIQINFGNFVCTLGFPAIRAGVVGFITNSHCTTIQGGVNNTAYHQPLASGILNRVGMEIRDPFYFVGGACPAGRRCRYSDSAFARVPHPAGPAAATLRGFIAKPINATGSLTIGASRFRITSENTTRPLVNTKLNKVGRTTGWSQGTVRFTCTNTNVSGSNITQLCQDIVKANVAGGDSGSPVFRIVSGNNVRLYGVLWGGGSIAGVGTVFVFSNMSGTNVQRASEMGPLTTCAAGFGC
jgi:hypothetical protein